MKAISLLRNRALHFASLHSLADVDPYEGAIPYPNEFERLVSLSDDPQRGMKVAGESDKRYRLVAKNARHRLSVNCWHINKHESVAMWKLYAPYGG
jgi:hypothetical protein